ncbi:FHA domain-containing protein [Ideonella paludis]|uniref:FHA domain-containing protein n=1 Tax=Ideonella paludis TaxID=1233411 RepID=A0ABS5E0Q6_9BURK|nr:FHA domain-containing protein [Ideonella paludis]MBQ0936973.1 FHA domain-containing protein [Ideonella paludis]
MDRPTERVALIEVLDRDGQVLRTVDVHTWPISLGRSLSNVVVLDDPHVSASHAVLERAADGTVLLRVGDTLNGVQVGRRRLSAGSQAALQDGVDTFTLGQSRIRLRLAETPLAPEQALTTAETPLAVMTGLMLALVLMAVAEHWVSTDPGGEWTQWLGVVLGLPLALAGWCLIWALASKLFRHGFDFRGHMATVLKVLVPVQVAELLLPQLAASLDWPVLWQAVHLMAPLALAVLVWQHGQRVLPSRSRTVSLTVGALTLAGVGVTAVMQHQRTESLKQAPYMSTLPLPALRWHASVPAEQFMNEARSLEEGLKARVATAQTDDSDDELDEE